jgi:F-type H+-transporting ATPase subunit alpha
MSVSEQVIIIYAGTHGYIDKIPVNRVHEYEKEFIAFMNTAHPDILKEIVDTGKIENEDALISAVKSFTDKFAEKIGITK